MQRCMMNVQKTKQHTKASEIISVLHEYTEKQEKDIKREGMHQKTLVVFKGKIQLFKDNK